MGAPAILESVDRADMGMVQRRQDARLALAALADTGTLTQADPADFDAVFYPGGHGPLFDLAKDAASIALIETFYAAGKPVPLNTTKHSLSLPIIQAVLAEDAEEKPAFVSPYLVETPEEETVSF